MSAEAKTYRNPGPCARHGVDGCVACCEPVCVTCSRPVFGRKPVAWRMEYDCGHVHFVDDFALVGRWDAGKCPWEDGGSFTGHVPLYERTEAP